MKKSIPLLFFVFLIAGSNAQFLGQSIFEDKEGESAIFLPDGGTFRLNTAEASIKLSFIDKVSTNKLFYGFDVSAKVNGGIASIISNGNISPGTKVHGIVGLQEFFHNSDFFDGWLTAKLGYEGSSFNWFNPDSLFAKQIEKISFNTFKSSLSLNLKLGGHRILAASIGYHKVNNFDDLDDQELTDLVTTWDSISNITRTYEQKTKVKVGGYKIFDQIPINLDFYWYLPELTRIGFHHFWRTKFTNSTVTHGLGTGLYLLQEDNPLSATAGIVLEVNDLSKLGTEGFGKNFTVNFVVGHNFDF